MKKFFSYVLILAILLVSIAAFNLMTPQPKQAEASSGYLWCYTGCQVIAKTYCHKCDDAQILAVANECAKNECGG